ncbi:MAG: hypothetical protein HPY76_12760 [Anaerolineae bacterium]|nr:hypothetical protein [Anaerolineae bacterium]
MPIGAIFDRRDELQRLTRFQIIAIGEMVFWNDFANRGWVFHTPQGEKAEK